MKKKLAATAALILLAGVSLAFAGAPKTSAAASTEAVKQETAKTPEFKDILFKLVRQDEYMDEAIDTLGSSGSRLNAHDVSATALSLKLIAGNLDKVSALNKTEFASVQPVSPDVRYIATILSYANKVGRKSVRVNKLIAQLAARNKRSSMRDAVSSGKSGRKVRGKKLDQILAEQQALAQLAADAKNLRAASRRAAATSRWLYIASK
jgi:hypothetical protein